MSPEPIHIRIEFKLLGMQGPKFNTRFYHTFPQKEEYLFSEQPQHWHHLRLIF